MPIKKFWYYNSLIWETAMPYLYMRTSEDHRILLGGKDDAFSDSLKRNAGVFASTRDGLPYIGSIPERPHTYFALGFGGNGVTFSLIAAQLLRDKLSSRKNPDLQIFSFVR